jgi:hypothetical protein
MLLLPRPAHRLALCQHNSRAAIAVAAGVVHRTAVGTGRDGDKPLMPSVRQHPSHGYFLSDSALAVDNLPCICTAFAYFFANSTPSATLAFGCRFFIECLHLTANVVHFDFSYATKSYTF